MKRIEYELKKGCLFREGSDLDAFKLATDISTIRSDSESPKRFFKDVVNYLRDRPSIAEHKGVSSKDMASEFLSLTILEGVVAADKRPGAMDAFHKCITNPRNIELVSKFAKVIRESIEDGTGAIGGLSFNFDNKGNMTLDAHAITDEDTDEDVLYKKKRGILLSQRNEDNDLDGIVIDSHLDGSA